MKQYTAEIVTLLLRLQVSVGTHFKKRLHDGFSIKDDRMRNKFQSFIILVILLNSCSSIDKVRIYSIDKSQCVSIITDKKNNSRYIINGNHTSIPKTDFVKLDISNIDPIGDEIGICWRNDKYDWEIVNHMAKILENRLDTIKYKFNSWWETDKDGIPNSLKYHTSDNCGTFDFESMKIYRNRGLIIEK